MYDEHEIVMTCPGCGAEVDVTVRIELLADGLPGYELLGVITTTQHNHGPGMKSSQLWQIKSE